MESEGGSNMGIQREGGMENSCPLDQWKEGSGWVRPESSCHQVQESEWEASFYVQ